MGGADRVPGCGVRARLPWQCCYGEHTGMDRHAWFGAPNRAAPAVDGGATPLDPLCQWYLRSISGPGIRTRDLSRLMVLAGQKSWLSSMP